MTVNRYLEKLAFMSDENKQVAKTFATQAAIGLPAHVAGAAIGGAIGSKMLNGAANSVNTGLSRTAAKVSTLGSAGKWMGKHLPKGGLNGAALGGFIGLQAAGGIGDLLALKHGFHGKIKKDE